MTDPKSKRLRKGLTTTQTQTTTGTETNVLTAQEEQVVRMLHGLGEQGDFGLSQKKSADPEVNARLQVIEAMLLAEMHGEGPLAEAPAEAHSPKSKILQRLKEIEDKD